MQAKMKRDIISAPRLSVKICTAATHTPYTIVHLVLHGTRLLWLYGFTDRELIVAHRSRSAQGRVHFITTFSQQTPSTSTTRVHSRWVTSAMRRLRCERYAA